MSIGVYGRFAILLNTLIFIYQQAFMGGNQIRIALAFGFNYEAIIGAHQYYRILTAAFSHEGFGHIFFNMCALVMFSISQEKPYGSLFFALLNMVILLMCSSIKLMYDHIRIFWLPLGYGGGSFEDLNTYGYGYSGILFGLLTLWCLTGDSYRNCYGVKVRKIFIPFIYLIVSSIIAENASIVGHLSGIAAGAILRYCGIYSARMLP